MSIWTDRNKAWEHRARAHGERAVFNWGHSPEELPAVTAMQRANIVPALRECLRPGDVNLLDFGCGYGRWSPIFAELVAGRVVGLDPTQTLLDLAQQKNSHSRVRYLQMIEGKVPSDLPPFDVVACIVSLSTILDSEMFDAELAEIDRVLRPGGLMFVVDNTAGRNAKPVRSPYSISRTAREYQQAFGRFVKLDTLGQYYDLGEELTIFAGRRDE